MDDSFVRDELFLLTVRSESDQEHAQLVQSVARVWPKVYDHARVRYCVDGRLRWRRPVDGRATAKTMNTDSLETEEARRCRLRSGTIGHKMWLGGGCPGKADWR